MGFTKRLHAGIIAGEITETVRIWHKPAREGRWAAIGSAGARSR